MPTHRPVIPFVAEEEGMNKRTREDRQQRESWVEHAKENWVLSVLYGAVV